MMGLVINQLIVNQNMTIFPTMIALVLFKVLCDVLQCDVWALYFLCKSMYFQFITFYDNIPLCMRIYIHKGGPQNPEFIYKNGIYKNYKNCTFIKNSYIFKLQSPSKYSPLDATYLSRHFFPRLKTVFELADFDTFLVLLPFFVSPLPHQQNVSL